MFIHLMVNNVDILEVDQMTQLIGKMYKFSKHFHIIDSYKYLPAVKEDKDLYSKYIEATTMKGKPQFWDNPDIFMITRKREVDYSRSYSQAMVGLVGGSYNNQKRKPQIKFDQVYHIFQKSDHHSTVAESVPKFRGIDRIPRRFSVLVGEATWVNYQERIVDRYEEYEAAHDRNILNNIEQKEASARREIKTPVPNEKHDSC